MLTISQAPGIRHSPFCQLFTLVVGGTDDRTVSIECKNYGLGSVKWEGPGSHGRLPGRGGVSADPKGQAGFKRENRIEAGVRGGGKRRALAEVQSEGGHSRNVGGSFKDQAKNTRFFFLSSISVLRFPVCSFISSML